MLDCTDRHERYLSAELVQEWGYDEVNINVGCPSDRVQSGSFGACLMQSPELVAQNVKQMRAAVDIPVTLGLCPQGGLSRVRDCHQRWYKHNRSLSCSS